jgi:hypothetical protein
VPALAADLVCRQVAVIVTVGGETSAATAKAATAKIPIVVNTGNRSGQAGARRQPEPALLQCMHAPPCMTSAVKRGGFQTHAKLIFTAGALLGEQCKTLCQSHLSHRCSHALERPILHLVFILSHTSAGKMYGRLALNDHAACLLLASNARP